MLVSTNMRISSGSQRCKMIALVVSLFAISTSVNVVWSASLDTLLYKSDKIVCPDGHFTCDDESTCCKLPNDEWSCCVFANAQCCADQLHCCPQGSTCDTVHKTCRSTNSNHTIPALRTKSRLSLSMPLVTKAEVDVKMTCPDRSVCPYAGAACCRQYTGRFGCCNYPLNVCCDDGLHCCHVGTVCDPIRYVCVPYPGNSDTWTHTWAETTPAQRIHQDTGSLAVTAKFEGVESKEMKTVCKDGQTCCPNKVGSYGICVLEDAVCCEDGLHCCPKGTTCDVGRRQCTVQKIPTTVTPWSTKVEHPTLASSTVCPDDESQCPDNATCCPASGNNWGCCPLASAVCCPDMKHCCPFGTHCTSQGTCASNLQSNRIPLLELVHKDHN